MSEKTDKPNFNSEARALTRVAFAQNGNRFLNTVRVIENVLDTSAMHARNEEFYQGIVRECGELLGPDTYVADDGSVMEDPLALKVVPVLKKLIETTRAAAPEGNTHWSGGSAPWNADTISRQAAEATEAEGAVRVEVDTGKIAEIMLKECNARGIHNSFDVLKSIVRDLTVIAIDLARHPHLVAESFAETIEELTAKEKKAEKEELKKQKAELHLKIASLNAEIHLLDKQIHGD